jgi:hypothetical protein
MTFAAAVEKRTGLAYKVDVARARDEANGSAVPEKIAAAEVFCHERIG